MNPDWTELIHSRRYKIWAEAMVYLSPVRIVARETRQKAV